MLRSYAAANGMTYLDLYPAFTDPQGLQRRELFNAAYVGTMSTLIKRGWLKVEPNV